MKAGVNGRNLFPMAPTVRTEDLIDAVEIARMLGLAHRNSVSLYQKRYPNMPRPVVDLGSGRPRLWLRQEIAAWTKETGRAE
jgi:glutathione-regulated potassium-efflux system ancillary protein KefG